VRLSTRKRVAVALGFLAVGVLTLVVHHGKPKARTVDFARVHHYSAADVRGAFAAHGIHLRYASRAQPGYVELSATPFPVPVTALYVEVGPKRGRTNWGRAPSTGLDEPVGNLLVHYGGGDAATLAAVKAAVTDLAG